MIRPTRGSTSRTYLNESSSSELSSAPSDDDLDVDVVNTQTFALASQATTTLITKKRKGGSGIERGEEEEEGIGEEEQKAAPKKKAKKAKGKKNDMNAISVRSVGVKMLVGAHVSMAKGVQNAVANGLKIGGNSFALFLKSQRKWSSPDMKEADAKAFRVACKTSGYDVKRHILPHGSYLVNLASLDDDKAKKGYDCFLDDLKRCERLGIGLYNFHPGSTLGHPRPQALTRVATALNRAHKETKFCITVLENMAGQGNIIGGNFEDLRDIIEQVENKERMGVCLDTCHLFAAGHDIRTQESYNAVMDNFDRIVGRKYLVALHINDSKAPLGATRDLHQNIGLGFLGLEAFRVLMNDERLAGLPLILETPMEEEKTWADEIKLLESLIGVSPDDAEFLKTAAALSAQGLAERSKAGAAVEKKAEKQAKKATKRKGGKRIAVSSESEDACGSDGDGDHHC